MNLKLKHFFIVFLILLFAIQVQADAPINYNKELASDVELRGTFFTDDNAGGFYVSFNDGIIQIDSDNHYTDKVIKIKGTALTSRLKKYNGFDVGYTHITNDRTITNEIKTLEIDSQGFAYLTCDFSTVIINGMTGTTTTTLTGLSGNQSISVPDGSSYDFEITNHQVGAWQSTDGKSYQNKSLVTINGSMVTTESGIPLQLYINLAGVNGSGDIGIAYTNLTAIPREIESIVDDNVSNYFTFDTISGVDSEFLVLWGANNNTEPAADSTYGREAVWDNSFKATWHMNTNPAGSAPQLIDSTSNNNNGTTASMVSGDLVNGTYGKEYDFGATTKYIDVPDSASLDLTTTGELTFVFNPTDDTSEILIDKIKHAGGLGSGYAARVIPTDEMAAYALDGGGSPWETLTTTTSPVTEDSNNIITFKWNAAGFYIFKEGVLIKSDLALQNGAAITDTALRIAKSIATTFFGAIDYNGKISEIRISTSHSANYITTTHKNLNNPTASDITPFYKSIGTPQQAQGSTNITTSIIGDNNIQNYNTSQSREFTLTPTGTTNNVLINTTSTDYNVTVTTYWTENTTLIEETVASGYVKQYINYTPSANITSADLNTTIINDLTAHDYLGATTSTLNGASKTTTRVLQEVNASVGSLTKDVEYLWNVTIPYNNIFTLSEQVDKDVYLGESESFTDSTYNDPEGLPIDTRLWKFGDADTSSSSNPSHIYTTVGNLNANYSVTETATVSPQTVTKEFNVSVEVQPVQNLTSTTGIDYIQFDWDNYSSVDYWNISQLNVTIPFTPAYPVLDGIKDACYDCCCGYGFVGDSPNPYTDYGKELIYILRNDTYLILYADGEDNDGLPQDDEFSVGIDASNNNLSADDRKFILGEGGTVTAKQWSEITESWTYIATNAQGVVVGAGTPGAIQYEMFIPVSELDTNFTNGSTVKFMMSRTHTGSTPNIESYYPHTLENDTDATLWRPVLLSETPQYTYINNTSISEYNVTGLDPYTWYQHQFTAINGSHESSSVDSADITQQILLYSVSGYILDISGNPVAGAFVYAENGFVGEGDTSDVYGFYEGTRFKLQNYTITANKSGYVDNFITVNVTGNLTNQNITLTAFEMTDWMLWEKLLEIEAQNEDIKDDIKYLNSIIWVASLLAAVVVISVLRKKIEEYE